MLINDRGFIISFLVMADAVSAPRGGHWPASGGVSKNSKRRAGKWLIAFIAVALVLCTRSLTVAATVQLPQTGQTGCWDASGNPAVCAGTGQDGDTLRGAAWPSPRFTDTGDGTVTDTLTGLIWLKNANCTDTVGGVAKASGYLTWNDALTWSNTLASGDCGLSDGSVAGDWRLPTVNELQNLVNPQWQNSAIWFLFSGFTNVQLTDYWSSTTYARTPQLAWVVFMSQGSVSADFKTYAAFVWPVRGGQ